VKPLFKVFKAGVYASVQDEGRFEFRAFGVPVAGPMDKKAFLLGQEIIGNVQNKSSIELFLGGLTLKVLSDHYVVITGADLTALLDNEPFPLWKAMKVSKGQVISFKKPVQGSIAYIIPLGGIVSPVIMGSQSVYPKGNIGSVLIKDEIIYGKEINLPKFNRGLVSTEIPAYFNEVEVNVWPSPHQEMFCVDSIEEFFRASYTLKTGDRMGYFFSGPQLAFKDKRNILSEATQFGTIQVPNNGQPIVLMADAQTVGGYPTIGKVAEDDLWKIAQLRSGGKVRFQRK